MSTGRGYLRLLTAQARGQAQYRASFWFDAVSSIAFGLADIGAVLVLFHAGGTLGGFRRAEGLLMAAIAASGFALADLWTPARLALTLVAPLAGGVLFGAVFVASATVAFWWIDSGEFANGFTYGGRDFTAYPMNVYEGFFRRFFAYGLGFAFAGYYPALALLGRPDPLGGPAWLGWAAPAVALVAAALAAAVWRTGIRRYRSTGS
jgi:ABC-2 type transport system permease protein